MYLRPKWLILFCRKRTIPFHMVDELGILKITNNLVLRAFHNKKLSIRKNKSLERVLWKLKHPKRSLMIKLNSSMILRPC